MMDNEHTKKKINLYFSKLEKGDAIWINGWKEVVKGSLKPGVYVDISKAFDNGARLTTLEHYNPQGGEKVICLGVSFKFTFGKTYTVHKTVKFSETYIYILDDDGNITFFDSHDFKTPHCWGIIPRYEQVKNKEKEDGEMNNIKMVEEVDYTGKFKLGDEVRVVGLTNEQNLLRNIVGKEYTVKSVDKEDKTLPYYLTADGLPSLWFNEAELELVKNTSKTTITEQVNKVIRDTMSTGRPASSHYHIDNNGNDVWQFADDNLSDERVKGFHQINAIKYVSRYNKKHDSKEKRIEDLKKAKVSIDKLIELERKSMTSKGCDVVEE